MFPLLNIEKFTFQKASQNFMEYVSLKILPKKKKQFWNMRKISIYREQNQMKKIEIDEYFLSYYSVKEELFFLNMEYLHQKCFYFLES